MSELTEHLGQSFQDEAYRNAYAESFMNSFVAAQIKTLREENDLTQEALAQKIGTKQAGISRLENVNYSAWKVETLRKLARAFKLRLRITFEEYGTLPTEIEGFNRDALVRKPFDEDPVFFPNLASDKKREVGLNGEIAGSQAGGQNPDLASKEKEEVILNNKMSNEPPPKRPQPVGTLPKPDSEAA